jgi:hypothetical protein
MHLYLIYYLTVFKKFLLGDKNHAYLVSSLL